MKAQYETYTDHKNQLIPLDGLDPQERGLLEALRRRAQDHPDWNDFENFWTAEVATFYGERGFSRAEISQNPVYRVAQDISARLAIGAGMARPADYRDQLEELIRNHFQTRREFCRATGLTEDMLSHVLAHRKHLAIGTLVEALGKVGYTIRIVPCEPVAAEPGD